MQIDPSALKRYRRECKSDLSHRLAMNAVTASGVIKSATDVEALKLQVHEYSLQLKSGAVTDQQHSGRCWMFAALNAMRYGMIKRLNLESFEFSQVYPLFWDKLEKSNYFLENILSTLEEREAA